MQPVWLPGDPHYTVWITDKPVHAVGAGVTLTSTNLNRHGATMQVLDADLYVGGQQRRPCPKGHVGSVLLECQETSTGEVELVVLEESCEEIPDDVCSAFGVACGVEPECLNLDGDARCSLVQERGLCSKTRHAEKCRKACEAC